MSLACDFLRNKGVTKRGHETYTDYWFTYQFY